MLSAAPKQVLVTICAERGRSNNSLWTVRGCRFSGQVRGSGMGQGNSRIEPPGFEPNQTSNTTATWATISQINVNTNAPTACPSGCDTVLPNASNPSQ
jgi:hypothetical protein